MSAPVAEGDEMTPWPHTPNICLLYTSDAADERSSVDLGGRRIIKKKKNESNAGTSRYNSKRTRAEID